VLESWIKETFELANDLLPQDPSMIIDSFKFLIFLRGYVGLRIREGIGYDPITPHFSIHIVYITRIHGITVANSH
jgi:hypothetical protein